MLSQTTTSGAQAIAVADEGSNVDVLGNALPSGATSGQLVHLHGYDGAAWQWTDGTDPDPDPSDVPQSVTHSWTGVLDSSQTAATNPDVNEPVRYAVAYNDAQGRDEFLLQYEWTGEAHLWTEVATALRAADGTLLGSTAWAANQSGVQGTRYQWIDASFTGCSPTNGCWIEFAWINQWNGPNPEKYWFAPEPDGVGRQVVTTAVCGDEEGGAQEVMTKSVVYQLGDTLPDLPPAICPAGSMLGGLTVARKSVEEGLLPDRVLLSWDGIAATGYVPVTLQADEVIGGAGPVSTVADPVNTATGALVEGAVDLAVSSYGLAPAVERTYDSSVTTSGLLGQGWRLGYEQELSGDLTATTGAVVIYEAPDGHRERFTREADGSYTRPPASPLRLSDTTAGFEITAPGDRSAVTFDASGRLTGFVDANGNTTTVSYSSSGVLDTVTAANGRSLQFTVSSGLVTGVASSDGRSISYSYTSGQLTSVTETDGRVWGYRYDANGRLDQALDPAGAPVHTTVYDSGGRVTSQTDAVGETISFDYADMDFAAGTGVVRIIDARGATWTDVYVGRVLTNKVDPYGNQTVHHYNGDLRLEALDDDTGGRTRFSYDSTGRMTATALADGTVLRTSYTAAGDVAATTDADGFVTSYSYDTDGNLTSVTTPNGADAASPADFTGASALNITTVAGDGTSGSTDGTGTSASFTGLGDVQVVGDFGFAGMRQIDLNTNEVSTVAWPSILNGYYWVNAESLGEELLVLTQVNSWRRLAAYNPTTQAWRVVRDHRYSMNIVGIHDSQIVMVEFPNNGGEVYLVDPTAGAATHVATLPSNASAQDIISDGTTIWFIEGANAHPLNSSNWSWGNPISIAGGDHHQEFDVLDGKMYATAPHGVFRIDMTDGSRTLLAGHDTESSYADGIGTRARFNDPHGLAYDAGRNRLLIGDHKNFRLRAGTPAGEGAGGRTTSYTYDARGLITSVTGPDSQTTTFSYDAASGERLSATAPDGAVTSWTYDAAGRVSSTVDPRGNVAGANPADYTTIATYDDAGRVLTETDQLGRVVSYSYDTVGRLDTITDPTGRSVTYGYDAAGRTTSVQGPDSSIPPVTTTYDPNGNVASRTDAAGRVATFTYDYANQLTRVDDPGGTATTSYDGVGRVTSKTDYAGNTTSYSYDAQGRITAIDRPGSVADVSFTFSEASRPTTMVTADETVSYSYDATNGELREVARENLTTGTLDTFSYTYDTAGRLSSRTVQAAWMPSGSSGGTSSYAATASGDSPLAYYRLGSTAALTDEMGGPDATAVGTLTSATGLIASDTDTAVTIDAQDEGFTMPYTRPADTFTVEAWVQPDSTSATWDDTPGNYEASGSGADFLWMASKGPSSSSIGAGVAIGQNWIGVSEHGDNWGYNRLSHTFPSARTDPIHVVLVVDLTHTVHTTDYTLFIDGTVVASGDTSASSIYAPYAIGVTTGTSAYGNTTTGAVDETAIYQRALTATEVSEHYAAARSYSTAVSGDSPTGWWRVGETSGTTAADATGNGHDGTYTGGFALGGSGLVGDSDTAVHLDGSNGYLDVPNSAAVQTSAWSWETWVKFDTAPSGTGIVSEAYTGSGDRVMYALATSDGTVGQVSGAQPYVGFYSGSAWYGAVSPESLVAGTVYHLVGTYDGSTLRIYVNGQEKASAAASGWAADSEGISVGRRWDGAGNIDYVDGVIDEPAFYNRALTATEVADHYSAGTGSGGSDGDTSTASTVETFTYDVNGRLDSVTVDGAVQATYGYDPAGQLTSTSLANGVVETRAYDRAGRLHHIDAANGATVLHETDYTFDDRDMPVQVVADGVSTAYQFDLAGRLTRACYNVAACGTETDYTAWTHGPTGNRLTEATPAGTTSYAYDSASGRLTSYTPPGSTAVAYSYDASGNVTAAGADTFAWDAVGRMTSATVDGTVTSYGYDLSGNRASETVASTTTETVWDPASGAKALQRDPAGQLVRAFLPHGLGVDEVDGRQFFHGDALGSIEATSDAAGAVAWTYDYTEYGTSTATWAGSGTQTADSPVGFTGQLEDPTGLIHLKARQYHPKTGTFLSPDPAGWGYTYGHANPLVFVDPYGLFGWSTIRRPLQFVNTVSGWVSVGAGAAAFAITVTGVGAPLGAVLGTVAMASGAVAAASGAVLAVDKCVNDKGGCVSSLMFAALDAGGAGRITRALRGAPVLSRMAKSADRVPTAPRGAPGGSTTFHTVQSGADEARLLSGGTPWPSSPNRAHLGEGVYAWGSRAEADADLQHLSSRGVCDLRVCSFDVSNADLAGMRHLDVDSLSNPSGFMQKFSALWGGTPSHGYDYVTRGTNFGTEHFFSSKVFDRLRFGG